MPAFREIFIFGDIKFHVDESISLMLWIYFVGFIKTKNTAQLLGFLWHFACILFDNKSKLWSLKQWSFFIHSEVLPVYESLPDDCAWTCTNRNYIIFWCRPCKGPYITISFAIIIKTWLNQAQIHIFTWWTYWINRRSWEYRNFLKCRWSTVYWTDCYGNCYQKGKNFLHHFFFDLTCWRFKTIWLVAVADMYFYLSPTVSTFYSFFVHDYLGRFQSHELDFNRQYDYEHHKI